jgi:ABC-type sugar transport system ATPase subunit
LQRQQQEQHAGDVLERLGVAIDVRQPAESFPIATQQLIEIAKALVLDAELIVMDEPTSALREPEVERLFTVIAELTRRGCGVIYITHKLEEVYHIADRITVLRDGEWIVTAPAAELPAAALIRCMVGRELPEHPTARRAELGPPRLVVKDLTVLATTSRARPLVDRFSFTVRAGEIVGLAGLAGSGNSDLLWAIAGVHAGRVSGQIEIEGRRYRPVSLRQAIHRGLVLLTNDRQRYGLVPQMSVQANVTLASLPRVSPAGWLSGFRERRAAAETVEALDLRLRSLHQPVWTLSGGNQQKVVLGKWLNTQPRILLLDEPTRGVDVGAKHEIYGLMNRWSAAGHAIVLITSELPELLLMSDRIIVMHRGRRAAELDRATATQEGILHAAMGGTSHE